jgi:hypothetical protein
MQDIGGKIQVTSTGTTRNSVIENLCDAIGDMGDMSGFDGEFGERLDGLDLIEFLEIATTSVVLVT